MAWELPPSITRALDRLAISRVQRLEGEDSIVPTVELLSLDRPPFRKAGYRFFGSGGVTADATGASVILTTSSNRCVVVVDSIMVSVNGPADVVISMGAGFTAGGAGSVTVPENHISRPLPFDDARMTQRLGNFGGPSLYSFIMSANSQTQLFTEVLLLVPPPSLISGDVSCAVSITNNTVTLFASFSGRIWYSEE